MVLAITIAVIGCLFVTLSGWFVREAFPRTVVEEVTKEVPVEVTKIVEVVATARPETAGPTASTTETNSDCPDKAIRVEPQGLLQSDGSFVASIGAAGCVTVFEGRIWEAGKGIQPRHDIVEIDGAKDNFRYWEGNGWTIPSDWDPSEFACLLWADKQENWISQGIDPLPVKFWGFDPEPTCASITPKVAPPASEPTAWPSTTSKAATAFGGPVDRWESCPGEVMCWHLREGEAVTLTVPSNTWLEGWDGSNTIGRTDGPTSITIVGATLRPKK